MSKEPGMEAMVGRAAAALSESMRSDTLTRLRMAEGRDGQWGGGGRGDEGGGVGGRRETGQVVPLRGVESGGTGWVFRAADLARVREMVEMVRRLMFPGFFDIEPVEDEELEPHVARLVSRIAAHLTREVGGVMRYRLTEPGTGGGEAEGAYRARVVREFLGRLPEVRRLLSLDVQAAYDGDPAATHTDEVVLCYPGIDAVFAQRVAHELYVLGVPVLPRVISEQAHSRTGIDIHPGAKIGESFFVDHGTGVVIGETSVIGDHVKVYQGVTLGARSFPKDERGRVIRGVKRHPTIGNRVALYAGAVVLGGDTVIGDDCVIAGGVFVTESVPAGHVVQQPRSELVLRRARGASGGGGGGGGKPTAAGSAFAEVGWVGDGGGI